MLPKEYGVRQGAGCAYTLPHRLLESWQGTLVDCACMRLSLYSTPGSYGAWLMICERSKLSSHLHCFPI